MKRLLTLSLLQLAYYIHNHFSNLTEFAGCLLKCAEIYDGQMSKIIRQMSFADSKRHQQCQPDALSNDYQI